MTRVNGILVLLSSYTESTKTKKWKDTNHLSNLPNTSLTTTPDYTRELGFWVPELSLFIVTIIYMSLYIL